MNAEYPMIRFLENNGYDLSYTTDLDIARSNANNINPLLNHKVFLSVGHDEYWSKEERNNVEAAHQPEKTWLFSVATKFIGKQDGKTVSMVQIRLSHDGLL